MSKAIKKVIEWEIVTSGGSKGAKAYLMVKFKPSFIWERKTSELIKVDFEKLEAETSNAIYKLEPIK